MVKLKESNQQNVVLCRSRYHACHSSTNLSIVQKQKAAERSYLCFSSLVELSFSEHKLNQRMELLLLQTQPRRATMNLFFLFKKVEMMFQQQGSRRTIIRY